MTDDQTLVEALKAAGHTDAANAVRDKALADQLREAGHDSLADALVSPPAPAPKQDLPVTADAAGPADALGMLARGYANTQED